MNWLRRWGWLWPVATVAIMVPFGADPVMVYMIGWKYPVKQIYLTGTLVGNLELLYWNWLFGWGQAHITEIKAVRDVIRDAVSNFKIAGLPEELRELWEHIKTLFHVLWNIFLDLITERLHLDDPKRQKFIDVLLGILKKTSRGLAYGLIFGIGTIPLIGGGLGIATCRALPWRGTFTVLTLGNTAKVMVIAWTLTTLMSPFVAKLCLVGYGTVMVLGLVYLVRKRRAFKNRR